MINAGFDGCDEHARGIWVGLFGNEDEDVLDVKARSRRGVWI
jgi:hypothetical protein